MPALTRRRILRQLSLAAAAGLAASVPRRARAAEFALKYANNLPDGHPMNVRAREMAAAIKAETNGRVDLQIFPNNQLGSDTDMLSQIRSGGVEFFTLSGLILGWQIAFPKFPAGTSATLYVPSGLAYGTAGSSPKISPNAVLVFEVTLTSFQ